MKLLLLLSLLFISLFSRELSSQEKQLLNNSGVSINSNLNKKEKVEEKKVQVVENDISSDDNKDVAIDLKGSENIDDLQIEESNDEVALKKFGSSFFNNKNKIDPYSIPTPSTYKLLRGDVLSINIYGTETEEFLLKVDRKGYITIPQIGLVKLVGLTLDDAKEIIEKKIRESYPTTLAIVVNIDEFTAIQITLSGFVKVPGLYNLSSFSTIKDALIASGGILKKGSFRNIELKRAGKTIRNFDLYDLVRFGKSDLDEILQSGDIIYVNAIKKEITLSGEVNIPAIYELKDNETYEDLINNISGLKPQANKNILKLKRYLNNKVVVSTVTLNELYKTLPKNGDNIFIHEIGDGLGNFVSLEGNIFNNGNVEIPENRRLSTLLKKQIRDFGESGFFRKNTNFKFAKVERLNSSKIFNPQKLLESKEEVFLKTGDQIIFYELDHFKDNQFYTVVGNVVEKQNEKYKYYNGLVAKDLFSQVLFLGNGDNDKNNVEEKNTSTEIVNIDKQKIQIKRIEGNKFKIYLVDLNLNPDFPIQVNDQIKFFDFKDLNEQSKVVIKGEVYLPNEYYLSENMTLKDLIALSGGLTKKALKNNFELVRYNLVEGERFREVTKLSLNEEKSLNIKLRADDEITIFGISNWTRSEYIELKGEVKYPGKYAISKGEKLSSVIKRAGGFTENAFLEGAIFSREEIRELQKERIEESMRKLKRKALQLTLQPTEAGESKSEKESILDAIDELEAKAEKSMPIGRISLNIYYDMQRFIQSDYDITLKNEDKLFIPRINDTVSVLGEVFNQNTFVYNRQLAVEDYINRAGGITDTADENMIYVVKANGEAVKYEKSFFYGSNVDVFKGDTIVVPLMLDSISDIRFAKDITSILYQLAVAAASLKTLGAL